MAGHAHPHRAQFERELLAYIAENGEGFDKPALVRQYVDVGVGESTVWRWIETILRLGRVARRPGAGARTPPPPAPPPMPGVATMPEILPVLPPVPSANDVATKGLVPVLDLLRDAIEAAQDVMRHSRTIDGKVRNARLLQSGAEHLRRAVETAAKLNERVAVEQEMQVFQRILMEEIGAEPPALQERILNRIRRACDNALADCPR